MVIVFSFVRDVLVSISFQIIGSRLCMSVMSVIVLDTIVIESLSNISLMRIYRWVKVEQPYLKNIEDYGKLA